MSDTDKWQPIETAPLDSTQILLAGIMPWPVLAAWNNIHKKWCCAMLQVEPVRGVWEDTYFENDYLTAKQGEVMWMPLPNPPKAPKTEAS